MPLHVLEGTINWVTLLTFCPFKVGEGDDDMHPNILLQYYSVLYSQTARSQILRRIMETVLHKTGVNREFWVK